MYFKTIWIILLSSTIDVIQCKYTYHPNIPGWINVHKVIATWNEAHHQCQSEGSVLASPITSNLLKEMLSLIRVRHTGYGVNPYFTGIKAKHYPGPFVSLEGYNVTLMNKFYRKKDNLCPTIHFFEPSHRLLKKSNEKNLVRNGISLDDMPVSEMFDLLDPQKGDCLSMTNDSISVVSCWERLPYICYLNITITNCGANYTYEASTGSCYKIHTTKKKYPEAASTCIAEGGYLVVINNQKEAQVIKNMDLGPYPWTFVGLRFNENKKEWMSVRGEHLKDIYNVWITKPTRNGTDRCAVLLNSGLLKEYFCDVKRDFLCEKDVNDIKLFFRNQQT